MADIAALGFAIDSAPLVTAKGALTDMASAAGVAEKATRNLGQYALEAGTTIANENASAANAVALLGRAYEDTGSAAANAASAAQDAATSAAGASAKVGTASEEAGKKGEEAGKKIVTANDNAAKATAVLEEGFNKLLTTVIAVATAITSYFTLDNFIKNTAESEASMARLNATLSATGGASGQTSESLSKLSEEIASVSTFSKASVQSAEAIILSFQRISGDVFPATIQAAANLAARLNIDIPQAATLIGRALEEPVRGMENLRRAGIILTDTQKEQVKQFAAVNDAAGAQGVILKAVEANSAQAAAAMRATLGGALEALKHSFDDAFQVSATASAPLRQSIEDLNKAVSSEQFKIFVNIIGTIFFDSLTRTTQALTALVGGVKFLIDNMKELAPYIAIVGAELLIAFSPAIIGAIVSVGAAILGLAAGPIGLAVALGSIPILIYAFRDEIKQAIGVDVVQTFMDAGNFIINTFELSFTAFKVTWSALPDVMGDIWVRTVNVITEQINSIRVVWNDVILYFQRGYENLKNFTTGWLEDWKSKISSLVTAATSQVPTWLRKFLGIDGGTTGGAPASLEGAVPAPSQPSAVSTREFGAQQTPLAPNPYAANVAAADASLNISQGVIMSQDKMSQAMAAAGKGLDSLKQTAKDATTAINGTATPLGNMATASNKAADATKTRLDSFQKAVQFANEYIAKENAAAAALNLTGVAAKELTDFTELLNKATQNNYKPTADQIAQLHTLAAAMAQAAQGASDAKFLKDLGDETGRFINNEKALQSSVFMSAQATQQLRIETDLLTKAHKDGNDQNPDVIAGIKASAAAMAEAAQATRDYQQLGGIAKSTFTGFFSDLNSGLQQGKGLWESFGAAAQNALNNIANKLLDMATNKLWDAAFGGGGGTSGGGGLLSLFGLGGGGSNTLSPSGGSDPFAFLSGGSGATGGLSEALPIGFAGGGDYDANTPRIVGEKGPEIDVPKSSGTIINSKQLSSMMSGDATPSVTVSQTIHFGSDVTPQTMARWAVIVGQQAKDGAITGVAQKRSRGGQMKQVFKG